MKQRLLKTIGLALLCVVGASNVWADDPVNWLSGATVKVNYASNDEATTLTVTDGTVTFTPATDKTEIRLTVEKDQTINNGQIFVLIEGTNIKKDDAKLAMVSIDNSTTDSDSKPYGYTNANAIPYAPSSQLTTNPVVILAPLSRAADGTDPTNKPNGSILLEKFKTSESMTVNKIQVIVKLVAANTETSIKRVGMYTLGEITQLYSEFKKIKWQYKENNLLGLQDGNSSTYSADQKTISLVSGKTISMDVAKILFKSMYGLTSNYTEIDVRNLGLSDSPTALKVDLLSTNTSAQYLFSNANTLYRLFPTMRIKSIQIASRSHYQYKDGVNLTDGQVKTNHSTPAGNVYDYTRNFKEGYNSCVLPFDVTISELPTGLSAWVFGSATAEGVVTFTPASGTLSAGTPCVIKAEEAGLYLIPAASTPNQIASPNSYYATDASNNISFVGSFVNKVPDGDYTSTMNYGITTDGTKFAKMGDGIKTTFYRAFLADSRPSSARELSLSFSDDETTGIESVVSQETKVIGSVYYNLNGQRVESPRNGLYIVNGKKVFIK